MFRIECFGGKITYFRIGDTAMTKLCEKFREACEAKHYNVGGVSLVAEPGIYTYQPPQEIVPGCMSPLSPRLLLLRGW